VSISLRDHIPGLAAVCAIAFVSLYLLALHASFDALTSDRSYRPKRSRQDAAKEIQRCSGSQFAPEIVKAFLGWTALSTQLH